MISSKLYLHKLDEFFLGSTKIAIPDYFSTISELIDDQENLQSDISYFCSAKDIKNGIKSNCMEECTIFICDYKKGMPIPQIPEKALGILLSCSVQKSLNILSSFSKKAQEYKDSLQKLIAQGGNAHQFIIKLASIAEGDAVLLDENEKVIFTSDFKINGILQRTFSKTGDFPQGFASGLLNKPNVLKGNVRLTRIKEYNTVVFAITAEAENGMHATVLLEAENRLRDDFFTLMNIAHEILQAWMFSGNYNTATRITTSFQNIWDKIRVDNNYSDEELRNIFQNLPHPIKGRINVAVIIFAAHENVPYNYLLAKFRNIDPEMNVAVYNHDIILILPPRLALPGEKSKALEENEMLNEILQDFNGHMMYGNYTGRPQRLKEVVFLTKKTLLVTLKIRTQLNSRSMFYDDYASYCLIDLAAQNFVREHSNYSAHLLMHPAILSLNEYDKDHNDNLEYTLLRHLMNERNVSKTAEDLHMHRNTVMNKINKIQSIAALDLEDPRLRQRLILSSQLLRYFDMVLSLPRPRKE